MVHPRQEPGLRAAPRLGAAGRLAAPRFGPAGVVGAEHLHRHRAPQSQIQCFVHVGRAAAAQETVEPVAAGEGVRRRYEIRMGGPRTELHRCSRVGVVGLCGRADRRVRCPPVCARARG